MAYPFNNLTELRLETKRRRILQPFWNSFQQVILPHLHKKVGLCISGGADSRALLEAMALWPVGCQSFVTVMSVDHGIRAESHQESVQVLARAKVLGFETKILFLRPLLKTDEATLRKQRYEALWTYAKSKNISAICTAHHQGDDAEGFLMDLFGLGGGHEGSAMDAELRTDFGLVLRPFLSFTRKTLLELLTVLNQVDYFTDPTNENSIAKRSQMRSFLNEELLRFHPNPYQRLANIAKRRGEDLKALYFVAEQLIEVVSLEKVRVRLELNTPDAILWRAIMQALKILVPEKDLRQTSNTLFNLVEKAKKMTIENREGLDQTACSFTVSSKNSACFDLPGVVATITLTGIELQKTLDKNTFLSA